MKTPYRHYLHIAIILVMISFCFDENGMLWMPMPFFTAVWIGLFFWDLERIHPITDQNDNT